VAAGAGLWRPRGAGVEGAGGARCKLSAAQLRELAAVLDAGPAAWGWDKDQCWTLARIAEVVCGRFGVAYTLAGLDLLPHRIGWSVQVPARRAAERDEARIAAWRQEAWPVVKGRRRTWAPNSAPKTNLARAQGCPGGRAWGRRGVTPVVKVTGSSNKRVSLAALICVKPGHRPRLIYRVHHGHPHPSHQRKGFTETDYARLLDAAHQQLGRPLVVVWDNLNAHVSAPGAEMIAARDWLTVCRLRPPMPTNSTPLSWCGHTSSTPWPTSPSSTLSSSPRWSRPASSG
jgi:transposase